VLDPFDPFARRPDESPAGQRARFLELYPQQKQRMEESIARQPGFLRPLLRLWFKTKTWRADRLYEQLMKERNTPPEHP
jgi:hypothetical protein